jgi:hypothetical protein
MLPRNHAVQQQTASQLANSSGERVMYLDFVVLCPAADLVYICKDIDDVRSPNTNIYKILHDAVTAHLAPDLCTGSHGRPTHSAKRYNRHVIL